MNSLPHPSTISFPPPEKKNYRILVVDDNEAIHHDFRKILDADDRREFDAEEAEFFGEEFENTPHMKFALSFALEGRLALESVKKSRESGERYSVVFTDMRMPGWDGLETAVRLWEIDPDLQIVICTAYSDKSWEEVMARVNNPERVLILKKPFDAIEVLQLAHALAEKWSLLQSSRQNFNDLEQAVCERTRALQTANGRLEWEIARHEATEAELQRSKVALAEKAALLDKAQDAIFVHDLQGKILYWNRSAARLYDWPSDQTSDEESHLSIGGDPAQWEKARQTTLSTGEWSGELLQRTGGGRELIVESRWSLVCEEGGSPSAFLVINTDITEKKQLEAKFLRAQRMEGIGTLAGGIAHDLNNILHPISLAMEVLRRQLGPSADRNLLDLVMTNADRATSLVKQVLLFARGAEGQRVAVPPNTLVDEVGNIIRATFPKTIDFQSRPAQEAWPFQGAPTQLHQVLLNLCVNARDAMPGGGTLTLSVENAEIDEMQATMQPEAVAGRYVVFSVTDTGTGIPENLREKIFDPFFTTKEHGKGTGLGLSTTLGIIRSHKGFISLTSKQGIGTTFRIFLPTYDTVASNDEVSDTGDAGELRGNNEMILVVDDEKPILAVMRSALESFGYRVMCAFDGAEAIKLYAQNRGQINGVITDISMPCMDGVALISSLKKLDPSVKVIAMTGMTSDANIETIKRLGIERIIPKPYASHTILRALQELLTGSNPGEFPARA